ncbi:MAG: type II toxin-antitoxin system PemK/MazF family toxin [Candidatus Paceibacteria bacterium]
MKKFLKSFKKGACPIFSSSGHEQKGRRPALIISNEVFNKAIID